MNLTSSLSLASKAEFLRTLPSIRAKCSKVHDLAKEGKLEYFDYHPENEKDAVKYCSQIIKRDFGDNFKLIPPHGRWQHFDIPNTPTRIAPLLESIGKLNKDPRHQTRSLIDLFLVSVLLDAGAGTVWQYKEDGTGLTYARSEGLAIASLDMFKKGVFSSDPGDPYRVDADGLSKLTGEVIAQSMQVSSTNPMIGIDGRAALLVNLASALKLSPTFFGTEGRPGSMIDFLEKEAVSEGSVTKLHISSLWHVLIEGLSSIWPTRTTLAGISLGDVWPCPALQKGLKSPVEEGDDLIPFHKLTQWLTYSLVPVIEKGLGWRFEGMEDMTGLPEYRNGGLLVDFGIMKLKGAKDAPTQIPRFEPSHPAIIEWRAMTVIELDRIHLAIHKELGVPEGTLSLPQVLEAATWKGGREIAKELRPAGGGPPINIISDGTVF